MIQSILTPAAHDRSGVRGPPGEDPGWSKQAMHHQCMQLAYGGAVANGGYEPKAPEPRSRVPPKTPECQLPQHTYARVGGRKRKEVHPACHGKRCAHGPPPMPPPLAKMPRGRTICDTPLGVYCAGPRRKAKRPTHAPCHETQGVHEARAPAGDATRTCVRIIFMILRFVPTNNFQCWFHTNRLG